MNLGTRSGSDGRRDHYASLGVRQELDGGFFKSVGANGTVDRYGLSVGATTQFEHSVARGDAFLQRSSKEGGFAGGMNLSSTVGTNGKSAAVSGKGNAFNGESAVIVDLASDFEDVKVRAQDTSGAALNCTRVAIWCPCRLIARVDSSISSIDRRRRPRRCSRARRITT